MTITLIHYLILSAILFALAVRGIVLLMSIELMLFSVNLNFVAFSRWMGNIDGQIFVFFILMVAAAETAIGLGILVVLFRKIGSIRADNMDSLKG